MSSKNRKSNTQDNNASRVELHDTYHGLVSDSVPPTEGTIQAPENEPPVTVSSAITQTADILKNINSIKDDLCKLPLDPCELDYINISVNPLMNILNQLSNASSNLAVSVTYLQNSLVVRLKKSKLKY